jgi:hypothetical protein
LPGSIARGGNDLAGTRRGLRRIAHHQRCANADRCHSGQAQRHSSFEVFHHAAPLTPIGDDKHNRKGL